MPKPSPYGQAAGVLLALAGAGTVLAGLTDGPGRLLAGAAAWLAALLLWKGASVRSKGQTLSLIGLGCAGMTYGLWHGVMPDPGRVLSGNIGLIALIVGVSFLQLIAAPDREETPAPRGPRAFRSTSLGLHLFAAVINMSTVFIVADRLRRYGPLKQLHGLLITRSFSAAAFWSPFFASMAAALSFLPDARILVLIAAGIPLAIVGTAITWTTIAPRAGNDFRGYPMRYRNLRIPGVMAVAVIVIHLLAPGIPVLVVVTLLAPLITALVLLPQGRSGGRVLGNHVRYNLPTMSNELWLFLSAGVLAAGIGSVIVAMGDWTPFTRFTALEAWIVAISITGISVFGIHPVITSAAFTSLLGPLDIDHNLMAMAILCGWALGMGVNPLSGLNLSLQARYGIDGLDMLRGNARYAIVMLLMFGLVVWLTEQLVG